MVMTLHLSRTISLWKLIYNRKTSKPSARIERWILRLQSYRFHVLYKSGATNPADFLSRHPCGIPDNWHSDTEDYINFVVQHSVPKAMTLKEIEKATNEDTILKGLRAAICSNHWETDIIKPYKPFKDELTVSGNNIVLRGSKIVLPKSFYQRAVNIAHEAHQGLSRTKALLREKVWFPGIDTMVQQTLESCLACQAVSQSAPPEPLNSHHCQLIHGIPFMLTSLVHYLQMNIY